jgi:hypothetical protein
MIHLTTSHCHGTETGRKRMLIFNGDGTCTAAALDVLMILHHVVAGTYHAAFFEEVPPPGPVQDVGAVKFVRLRCRMHHTAGATSLEGARAQLDELAARIQVPPENVWRDKLPYPWNGRQGVTLVVDNWRGSLHDAQGYR